MHGLTFITLQCSSSILSKLQHGEAQLVFSFLLLITPSLTMEDSSTTKIPIMEKPASLMEVGPNGNNLAVAAAAPHPVAHMQRMAPGPGQHRDLSFVRHVYGSGLAMKLAIEQKIAAQHEHTSTAPGIPSSGLYGDIVTGNDTTLEFRDFLALPENQPEFNAEVPHVCHGTSAGNVIFSFSNNE